MKFRSDRHGPSESSHQSPYMGKTYALSGLILGSGAAKQLENSLMVLGIDAAAVVSDIENRKTELGPAANGNVAGNAGLEIFQRIVDQIGENLLERQAVADDVRQWLDADLRIGLRGLMRD